MKWRSSRSSGACSTWSMTRRASLAVVALPEAEFYHFGTNRQMIESVADLQNLVLDEVKAGLSGARQQPDLVTQNSRFEVALRRDNNHTLWVENSVVPASWELASKHVITGVPDNNWELRLPAGSCLDFVPIGANEFCIRVYGFDDRFTGKLGAPETLWLGRPAVDWLSARGLAELKARWDRGKTVLPQQLHPEPWPEVRHSASSLTEADFLAHGVNPRGAGLQPAG